MTNSTRAILTAAALAAAVYFWVSYHPNSGPQVGAEAPGFSLQNQEGETVSLSQFRGKLVLVHFWATWCGTCVGEMPVFNQMVALFKGHPDLVILGLSLDDTGRGNGWKAVTVFERQIPIAFRVLMDTRSAVADLYGTYALPETYLIGRDGRVLRKFVGGQEWMSPKILGYLESELSKKSE